MVASARDELRIAIVACGALTELFYAPALATLNRRHRLKIAAVIDPNPDRVAAVRSAFPDSIGGATLADIPDGRERVLVASPAGFHATQTAERRGRGRHVLCEKPMARSAA